jgi:hypothetical protein
MASVADNIHSLGLKFGMYSSAGQYTCGKYAGSLGYEEIDAQTWASWGVDYIKCEFPNPFLIDMSFSKLNSHRYDVIFIYPQLLTISNLQMITVTTPARPGHKSFRTTATTQCLKHLTQQVDLFCTRSVTGEKIIPGTGEV